jgi:phosphodiesterase/alkaline phosphatase D-like protein
MVAAVAAALVVFPSISGADSTAPPVATTDPATDVASTSATLNGKVTPNDDAGASFRFEWGTTTAYAGTPQPTGSVPAGDTPQAVSQPLTGLTPATTYHFRLCADNGPPISGSDCGGDQSFRTPGAPVVSTLAPSPVSKNIATLRGSVNPNGADATWFFKYGLTSGNLTSTSTGGTESGTSAQSVSDQISGLSPRTTYFFQLCATNSVDTSCTSESSFTTPDAPSATTNAATSVGQTSATLNGSINPNGASTTYQFFWGTTSGNLTSNSGTPIAAGSGTSPVNVSRNVTGLTSAKTYFFKICATNSEGGPICGNELSFFTTSPPTVTTDAPTNISPSGATLNGSVNPNNDATSWTYSYGTSSGNYTSSFNGNLAAGTTAQPIVNTVALSPHTTYFVKLCATNGSGTACGIERSFFVPDVPTATTNLIAENVAQTTATLKGTVNPNGGDSTTYTFQWGTSSGNYNTGSGGGSLTTGTTAQNVQRAITGLAGNTVYFFRLCATNSFGGPVCGAEGQFQTLDAPTTLAGAASGVTTSGATLAGTVNPNGANVTSTFFRYGPTCSASDGWVAGCSQKAATPNTSTGRSPVNVSAGLTGLQTGTVFHYTLCATNAFPPQPRCDLSDHTFRTNAPPTATLKENKSSPGPLQVSFDGSASVDSDGSIASWSLSFGDGSAPLTGTGTPGAALVHTYANPGPYAAVLTVTDDQGVSAQSAPVNVVVPSITITDSTVTEGQVAAFVVTLSAVSNHDITVAYSTASATATDGVDYTNAQGVLLIPAGTCGPGSGACQITVQTTQDSAFEANETFTLNLGSPTGAAIGRAAATGTINNDDQAPAIVIRDFTRLEGNDGTKVAGDQTWAAGGNVTVADGRRFNQGQPLYIADTKYTFTGKNGNTLTGVTPRGSATNGTPAYQTSWLPPMVFEVDLCDPTKTAPQDPCPVAATTGAPVTVNFATRNGVTDTSATPVKAGYDYFPACSQDPGLSNPLKLQCPDALSQPLVIPAGASSGVIEMPNTALLIGNDTPQIGIDPKTHQPTQEFTRWFFMRITSATNIGVIRDPEATARIIDDDAPNPPLVRGDSLSAVTSNSATIATTVNPVGKETSVFVQFGKGSSFGSKVAVQTLPADSVDHGLTFNLTGLSPNTTYHYQVVATHDIGTGADFASGYGPEGIFATTAPPPPPVSPPPPIGVQVLPPGAETGDPEDIGIHNLTLTGSVVPNGAVTTAWLEIGRTTSYGMRTAAITVPEGPLQLVTFKVSGLRAGTPYHYRVVASHPDGKTTAGRDRVVPTATPMRVTLPKPKAAPTVTNTGRLPVSITCTGTILERCTVDVVVLLGAKVIGSATVKLRPKSKPTVIFVKLTKKGLAQLKLRGKLLVEVEASFPDGSDDINLISRKLTVLPPKAAARK